MHKSPLIFIGLLLIILLQNCTSNKLDIDVSDIKVELEVARMEQDLFNEELSPIERHQLLQKKYGSLYQVFFESMLGEGPVTDPMAATYLNGFVMNEDMKGIYQSIDKQFADFSSYENDLTEAFKHYKHYFPDSTLPKIVTFYSNFNANVFPMNDALAIGLDMYLGKDHEIVQNLPPESIPQFIKNKMEPKFLVADAMKYWLFNRFYTEVNEDFLSTIISAGKVMYLLDAMMPYEEDHIKMGYEKEEYDWCVENEMNIWQLIVDEEYLYTKDQKIIMQFISDGPFTKGLPDDSPSRTGFWLGWQMVRDYVNKTDISVLDLLAEKNYRKILKEYDPDE